MVLDSSIDDSSDVEAFSGCLEREEAAATEMFLGNLDDDPSFAVVLTSG